MDKEQLIKLADIAGFKEVSASNATFELWSNGSVQYIGSWQPHKSIAQAFEVLEGLGQNYDICKSDYLTDSYRVEIFYDNFNENIEEDGPTVPEAICKAVLKATEQGR